MRGGEAGDWWEGCNYWYWISKGTGQVRYETHGMKARGWQNKRDQMTRVMDERRGLEEVVLEIKLSYRAKKAYYLYPPKREHATFFSSKSPRLGR